MTGATGGYYLNEGERNQRSVFYSESRTAKYEPDKRGSAKWKIEKNRLIVYDNEALGYDIYAELRGNEKGNEDSLLFQSNNNRWNDEVYTRGSKNGLGEFF